MLDTTHSTSTQLQLPLPETITGKQIAQLRNGDNRETIAAQLTTGRIVLCNLTNAQAAVLTRISETAVRARQPSRPPRPSRRNSLETTWRNADDIARAAFVSQHGDEILEAVG